jgi:hypothetical protein
VSQIRLFIDEDSYAKSLVSAFRRAGLDVLTVGDLGRQTYSDHDQLIWAAANNRVLYSYNRQDFCRLHSEFLAIGQDHAGIIVLQQQRYSIGQQLKGLLNVRDSWSAEHMINQLLFLSAYI